MPQTPSTFPPSMHALQDAMSVHGRLVLNELERFNIGTLLAEAPLSI